MKYLLDTNILSEPLKAKPNPRVMSLLQEHQHEIVTATLVLHELYFGCYRLPISRKRKVIKTYISDVILRTITQLPYCDQAAKWHATERARLQSIGKTPSFVDGQIAAIAYVSRTTLVTRNIADFKDFSNLNIVNWHN